MTSDGEPVEWPRSLLHPDGGSFAQELDGLAVALGALSNEARDRYRAQNGADIAQADASKLLVVAGPGAGKSFLFLARIQHWLAQHPDASVYVASFVRRLVRDLQADVNQKLGLSEDDQNRVRVSTLHHLARSVVERNLGTSEQQFRPHIQVLTWPWDAVVWQDTCLFESTETTAGKALSQLQAQFHTEDWQTEAEWPALRSRHFQLCRFYNAIGFAEMIVLAREALEQAPWLNQDQLWIIDEYQDFNASEDHLIRVITETARGVLIAGDDEQALYQGLKSSHPEIIIGYYDSPAFANAMLPYCSRCSYYICLAASAFMAGHRTESAIAKVYLPFEVDEAATKVQVVATATPSAAVDYIAKFLEDHQAELDQHTERLVAGQETDPFLLVLSPDRQAKFYKTNAADQALHRLIANYTSPVVSRSYDYRLVADYFAVHVDPTDNFAVRKVLDHEGHSVTEVHPLLEEALDRGCSLSELQRSELQELFAKCGAVTAIAIATDVDPTEQAQQLAALLDLRDATALVAELAENPLSQRDDLGDDPEPVATAGAVSPVELMTIMKSKGLSARHVIVIGCDEVNMQQTSPLQFFVALTRARESLHLITCLKARGCTRAHIFVDHLPEELCEFSAYKKGGRVLQRLSGRAAFVEQLRKWGYRP